MLKTTINLEKELIRQNKEIQTPKELLLINEYEKYEKYVENDSLNRIGILQSVRKGQSIKSEKEKNQAQTERFCQERVFHISQIEKICNKYYLRFLPANMYKGTIDDLLAERISTFEIAYNTKCNTNNTMIVAPLKSFELQQRPVDPLLFHEINEEYYYLIHKWGNDLSITRRLLSLMSNAWFCNLSIFSFFILPLWIIFFKYFLESLNSSKNSNGFLALILTLTIVYIFYIFFGVIFVKKNDWNNQYDDSNSRW